jgi:hypothetical protein
MLQQSLPLNLTIAAWSELCTELRNAYGDLSQATIPAALIITDMMAAAGLPQNARAMVLSHDELCVLGEMDELETTDVIVKCQACVLQEATALIPTRRGKLLLCPDCAVKLEVK